MKLEKNYPKVSIVIPNKNGGKEPLECLKSIGKLAYPQKSLETIVVDDCSTDSSVENIKKTFPKVKLIELKSPHGFAGAINIGIKISNGKYIFIGNDDIVFGKESITKMVDFYQKRQDIGILGGKIYYKDKPKKISASALGFNFYLGSIKTLFSKSQIAWLQGCAIMIPKSVFKKIGLFDFGYFPAYFEDFDFCLRAKRAGYKLEQLPSAIFWHGYGKTIQKFSISQKRYWWYKNKIRFILKNANLYQIITSLFVLLLQIPYFLVKLDSRSLAILKGFWWNIRNLPKTIAIRKENI